MTTVTDVIVDVAGNPDFTKWRFRAPFRASNDGLTVVSGSGEQVTPDVVGGEAVLTVELDAGDCYVTFRSMTRLIDVPVTDQVVPLWDLWEAGIEEADASKYTQLVRGENGAVVSGSLDVNSDLVLLNNDGSSSEPLEAPGSGFTWVTDNGDGTATIG